MKKLIKWSVILGGLLVMLVVAAIVVVPMFVDIQSYKPTIEEKVSEATGRPFSLGGDLDFSLFPWVGVALSDLSLGNPEGFAKKDFVKVSSFEVRMKLLPLLKKQIEVKKFVLDGPQIYLEKKADGTANWEGIGQKNSASEEKTKETSQRPGGFPITSLMVGEFAVTNGHVFFADHVAKVKKEISGITLRLNDVSLENPIGISLQAMVDNDPVSVEGKVGPLGKEPGKGRVNIDIAVEAFNELKTQLVGHVVDPVAGPKFDFGVKVAPFSPRKIMAAFGKDFPVKTTDPTALSSVGVRLNVKGDLEHIAISDGLLNLDDSKLEFMAGIKEMAKPNVSFKLNLDSIDLDRYLPPASEKPPETKNEEQVPANEGKKIDYTPLRKLVLDGQIHAGKLVAHGAKIHDLDMKVVGENGVFSLDPFTLNLYEGNVSTVGKLNVQGQQPRTSLNLKGMGVQVGPLLMDSVKKDILEGVVEISLALSLKGDEPEMIKRTLNGKGNLLFEDGAIIGIDIPGMMRNIQSALLGGGKTTERPRTDFAELHVPFTLSNGVFNTPATKLSSPLLRVNAKGDADLVKETLNLKIHPKVVGTLKGQGDAENRSGLSVPIIVEGTFTKPKFRADMEGVIGDVLPKKEELLKLLGSPGTEKEQASSPEGKGASLEEQGKELLKGFGFGR